MKKSGILIPFLSFLLLTFGACGQQGKNSSDNGPKETAVPETVNTPATTSTPYGNIRYRSNYCIYIPSYADSSRKMDAIIFFDPHAHGEWPVSHYCGLAEKDSFILIGSLQSENDLKPADYQRIYQDLQLTLKSEPIKIREIILAGFSGGAKAAYFNVSPDIHQFIYCGAPPSSFPAQKLHYIGFAGKQDMNYSDLIAFDKMVPGIYSHELFEWDGKHEWPDSSRFQWALDDIRGRKNFTGHLLSMDAAKEAMLKEEDGWKKKYSAAMSTQPYSWWQSEIAGLQKKSAADESGMYARVISYVSLLCYSYVNHSVAVNDLNAAANYLQIYDLDDPQNPDAAYFHAVLSANKQDNEAAISQLQDAVKKGFSDLRRLVREPAFQSLNADSRFQAIKAQLH